MSDVVVVATEAPEPEPVSRETEDVAVDRAVEVERRFAAIEDMIGQLFARSGDAVAEAASVAESVAESVAADVAESVAADVAEIVAETVAEPVAEDVAEIVAEDVAEPVAEESEPESEDVSPHRKSHWWDRPWREWRDKT